MRARSVEPASHVVVTSGKIRVRFWPERDPMDDTPDASEDPHPSAPEAGTGTNRRVLAIVAGVIAVLVVAGVAIAATRDSGDSAAPDTNGVEQQRETSTTLTPKQAAEKEAAEKRAAAAERRLAERAAEERRKNASTTTVPGGTPTDPGTTPPTTTPAIRPPVTPPTTPPTILQAYIAGYNQKCADIWKIANADGTLWDVAASEEPGDPGAPFVVDDCTSQIDETEAWYYETTEEARAAAAEDAAWNLGFFMVGTVLRNTDGTATWNY